MIDYNKIYTYAATMFSKSGSCCRLADLAINDLFGKRNQLISEKDLHDGFEYIIAKNKKEVEETHYVSIEQKESEKRRREFILRQLEDMIKSYLTNQNRLV